MFGGSTIYSKITNDFLIDQTVNSQMIYRHSIEDASVMRDSAQLNDLYKREEQ